MVSIEKLCSKFCDEFLDKCVIPERNIVSYDVVSVQDDNSVCLKVNTKENEYNFAITLLQDGDSNVIEPQNGFMFKIDGILMAIDDVYVKGYKRVVIGDTDLLYLKSILKSLAFVHSKSIQENYFKTVIGQNGHFLPIEVQNILDDILEGYPTKNIDSKLLREGIQEYLRLSREDLKPTKANLYVRSHILKNKLVFQSVENDSVKCNVIIINLALEQHLPLVYDVLLAIFYYSDRKLRQNNFHELIDYYYQTLESYLHKEGIHLKTILSSTQYDSQIKLYTPYIKLEMVYYYYRKFLKYSGGSNRKKPDLLDFSTTWKDLIWNTVLELYECIVYPRLSREDCYKIVRNKVRSSDYQFLSWTLTPLGDRPGFLGDYFKLKINIIQDGDEKTLNFFSKHMPTTFEAAKRMATESFEKEIFFYDTFINQSVELGLEEITDFAPKCYFSRLHDVLIFEDLSELNYILPDKTQSLSYDSVNILIKKLANLHACSLLYEEIMTEKLGNTCRIDMKYKEYVKETFLHTEKESASSQVTLVGMDALLNYILDAFPEIPQEMTMKHFKMKVAEALDIFLQKVKKSDKFRNAICQGDFWGGNFLFKKDDNDIALDGYIVDYQLIRYCPPTHDLFFLIYVNCDKETRTKYMQMFIDEYYNELSIIIKKYNFDVNRIYTYEQFLDCCAYMKSAAICLACLYLPMTLYPAEKMQEFLSDNDKMMHISSVDRKGMIHEEMKLYGPYRQRMREIIEDLYEICLNNEL